MTPRCALYARYSSDLQNERSAADQLAALEAGAIARGWRVVARYDDQGVSGTAMANRPGILQLLDDAGRGLFDVVFVEAQDRLSRGQSDAARIFELLQFHGVALEKLSGGAVTEISNAFEGAMNRLFLVELAAKTKRGLDARVKAGFSGGGRCYGYDIVGKGQYAVNPAQAAVVRGIYDAYIAGESPRAIAQRLNSAGEPGPRGGGWTASAIHGDHRAGDGVLHQALYRGERVFNRRRYRKHPQTGKRSSVLNPPGQWLREAVPDLRIVTEAQWAAVQAKARQLGEARPEQARRPKRLLSGLIKCGTCGGSMSLKGKQLVCGARYDKGPAFCSNSKAIDARRIEARVVAGIRDHMLAPDAVDAAVRAFHAELNARRAAARQASEIDRDLDDVGRRIDRAADAFERGVYDLDDFEARVAPLKAKRDALRLERDSLGATPVFAVHPQAAAEYRAAVADLVDGLDGEDADDAREAVRGLIHRVVFEPQEGFGRYGLTVQTKMAALLSQDGQLVGNDGCGDRISALPTTYASFAA